MLQLRSSCRSVQSWGAIVVSSGYFPIVPASIFLSWLWLSGSLLCLPADGCFRRGILHRCSVCFPCRLCKAPWLDYDQIILPFSLVFFYCLWLLLGSHQMHTALAWMHNSYVRANELLSELRDERLQRESTLKMLSDLYWKPTGTGVCDGQTLTLKCK